MLIMRQIIYSKQNISPVLKYRYNFRFNCFFINFALEFKNFSNKEIIPILSILPIASRFLVRKY